ncbi:alanyl-tRNA editing protein [Sphingosinicella sp. CPCC 101087]|uniref:alanyl-tRNA editing protein n=1 Tax=Sphingosinicella sp. CPCC 101087 TaxID=2497754 RepID=UPI00101BA219|nr:alanyl-tRNA editing protein [Sphingosinicella sp. CPCC 101087]
MADYLYHREPDTLVFETEIVARRPGAVRLERSFLHPGGGGQVSDRAMLVHASGTLAIVGVAVEDGLYWHLLDRDEAVDWKVEIRIDAAHRATLSQLHTGSHVLNALVFRRFAGALVTGAQINGDGSGRMDFDLPGFDNDRLRGLEEEINAVIAADLPVRTRYVPFDEARSTPGLIRSAAVAPPPSADGMVRIVEIENLDAQACGGTHLTSTAQSRPIRITKVENKGRHNRRVRFALD